jgi:hypothetical protein
MQLIQKSAQVLFALVALAHSASVGAEPVPAGAKTVIEQVHRAAVAKDFDSIRQHMAPEFSWSFGGDTSIEQAIAAWKKQPGYLRQLARITKQKCTYRKDSYVECPVGAGANFRAGFKATDGKWRMEYFLEGD